MSEARPLISIITPTFNSIEYLGELFATVDAQSYDHIEHVIVDGASTDGTVDMIRRYAEDHCVKWVSEPDENNVEATEKGLKMATGDFVVIIPSDDLIFPWTVSTVVDYFRAHPEVDVVHGDSVAWVTETDFWHLRLHKRFTFGFHARTQIVVPQATYIRRHVLSGKQLDRSLLHANDYDLMLRVTQDAKVVNIPEFLAIFRKRPGAINLSASAEALLPREIDIVRSRYIRTSGLMHWLLVHWDRYYGAAHRRLQLMRMVFYSGRSGKSTDGLKSGTPWRHFLAAYEVSGSSLKDQLMTLLPGRREYPIEVRSRPSARNLGAAERPGPPTAGQRHRK